MRAVTLVSILFISTAAVAQDSSVVLTWLDEPGRLLQSGAQTTLRVRVTDSAGNPVSGASVLFQAPVADPTGLLLPSGDGAPAPTATAASGDDGVASMTVQAGAVRGPYLVEAGTPGARSVTFGVANVAPGTPAPVLAASAARKTIESKFGNSAVVHGPVWIPAFTSVSAGGPPSIFGTSSTYTPSVAGTWLFWIDLNPGQLFGHPVQYITADASRNDFLLNSARYIRENWWPSVRLSGGSPVALLPPSAWNAADLSLLDTSGSPAPAPPCAIVLYGPGATGGQANFLHTTAFLQGGAASTAGQPATRDLVAQEVQRVLGGGCASVYFHLTANGFPPRTPRPESPGGSLGGVVLADATGSPADFVDYADLVRALLPLKGAPLNVVIEASYAGNAAPALAGQGFNGTVVTGADSWSPQATSNAGTPLNAALLSAWQAAPDASFSDIAAAAVSGASSEAQKSKPASARVTPGGPKALPVPNFTLSAAGLFDKATLHLPDDLPADASTAQVAVTDPRVADLDPRSAKAAASADLPLTVYSSSTGITAYQVQIAGNGSTLYQGSGVAAVGQEVSCSPASITLREFEGGQFSVAPGTLYDPAYNGSKFTARVLNDRAARLTNSTLTFPDAVTGDTLRFSALTAGATTIEISGTRAFGPAYTACIVYVTVIPSSGDGTSNATYAIAQTDISLQRVTTLLRNTSSGIGGQTLVGGQASPDDLLCTGASTPKFASIPATQQAFQRTVNGKSNGQMICFYPPPAGASTVLQSSSFLGGSGTDTVTAIAADPQGNLWLVGTTTSSDFPVTAGARKYIANQDLFISKLSRFGDKLLFSTYFGGNGQDIPTAVATDSAGNLYVAGYTTSPDFPVTTNAAQRNFGGATDAFLLKLDGATGALRYSTYFGGIGSDGAYGLTVDPQGAAYIAGQTSSLNLAVTPGAFQSKEAQGAPCPQAGGDVPCPDAFVARYSNDLSSLVYATYLGGNNFDYARDIAIDSAGNAIVTGGTYSPDFPTTAGVFQPARRSGALCFGGIAPCPDAFVTILNPAGTAVVASTYFGGDGYDEAQKVALDAGGNFYLLGTTASPNLPITGGAFQPAFGGGSTDAFVSVIGPGLRTLVGSTYFGTTGNDTPANLLLGHNGRVFISYNGVPRP